MVTKKAIIRLVGIASVLALTACAGSGKTTPTDTGPSTPTGTGVENNNLTRNTTPTPEVTVPEAPLETVFYFDFDSSVLKPQSRQALLAQADRLKQSGASVRLEGHADERGSREYNLALGERRANAVRDFLVLQGVSRGKIETVSYGEERPARSGSTETSYSANRRTELK